MPEITTIQARAVTKVIDLAAKAGVEPHRLLRAADLDRDLLKDPEAPISYVKYVSLYEEAARLTGDDAFGLHLGETVSLSMYDVIGYATMNAPTMAEAMDTWIRYYRLWSNGSRTTISIDGPVARIKYEVFNIHPSDCRQECESSQSMTLCLGESLIGKPWSPIEARFQHAAPADTSEHARVFKAPIRFQQKTNELIIDRTLLDHPIPKADTNLGRVLERHAAQLLEKLPKSDDIVDRVHQLLTEALRGGDPGLAAIAKRAGMSPRTLQRKLSEEGTSHQDLLDELRRNLSKKYLQEPEISIGETAFLLGFSDPSSFHRAFRRWTGMTPKEFQRKDSRR